MKLGELLNTIGTCGSGTALVSVYEDDDIDENGEMFFHEDDLILTFRSARIASVTVVPEILDRRVSSIYAVSRDNVYVVLESEGKT